MNNAPGSVPPMRGLPPTAAETQEPPDRSHLGHWHLVLAESAGEARQGVAPILAITGVVLWAVQTYGFHGTVPFQVSSAIYVVVPTIIGWLSTHVAFRKVTL